MGTSSWGTPSTGALSGVQLATTWLAISALDAAPARMTMSPPPAEVPTMPPPRAVAMRAKRATPAPAAPTTGPSRMTMSPDPRWTS
ncbi:MAG: hypothetical protein H0V17_26315 [Deltaproteobacteria bacterium]|nr:hypothetical protein [Deltaproteobacteria bacterium]